MDAYEVEWTCQHCFEENLDDYLVTPIPMCIKCGETYFWSDLLSHDEHVACKEALHTAIREAIYAPTNQ